MRRRRLVGRHPSCTRYLRLASNLSGVVKEAANGPEHEQRWERLFWDAEGVGGRERCRLVRLSRAENNQEAGVVVWQRQRIGTPDSETHPLQLADCIDLLTGDGHANWHNRAFVGIAKDCCIAWMQ